MEHNNYVVRKDLLNVLKGEFYALGKEIMKVLETGAYQNRVAEMVSAQMRLHCHIVKEEVAIIPPGSSDRQAFVDVLKKEFYALKDTIRQELEAGTGQGDIKEMVSTQADLHRRIVSEVRSLAGEKVYPFYY